MASSIAVGIVAEPAIAHLVEPIFAGSRLAAIVAGVRAIRRGAVDVHRRRMVATVGFFGAFLVLYLYRVALEGPTAYEGALIPAVACYALLAIHVTLAIVTVPLVYYVLLLAYAHPVSELSETNHPRVGRVAAALWLVSFALGVVVYAMFYWLP